jgi:hypothetical protein
MNTSKARFSRWLIIVALVSSSEAACGNVVTNPITTGATGAGIGGRVSGATGTGPTGTGPTGTGPTGTVATGTGGGATGSGGSAGGPSACPTPEPKTDVDKCSSLGQVCTYGGTQCLCELGQTWSCSTCPEAQPAEGSACANTGMGLVIEVCAYGQNGQTECTCHGDPMAAGTWGCSTCPATAPAQGSACQYDTFQFNFLCLYPGEGCLCSAQSTWLCGPTSCPATQPSPGTFCAVPNQDVCSYGAVKCTCLAGQFSCN